jgi:hypothetical protein
MNVKTYILTALATMAFIACSHIDEADRLIYVEQPFDNNSVSRHVLLEDFTGQRCVNCPKASDKILELQEAYGAENVIAVAIHSGPLGFHTNAKFVGLSTDTGDEYYNYWELEYQPVGLVNRGNPTDYTVWNTRIHEELQKAAPVFIDIDVHRNTATQHSQGGDDELTIRADVMGLDGTVSGHLQLWVTEDNVTAFQMMPDGTRNDTYLHQHVFRAALNGTWGEEMTVKEGEHSVTKSYTLKVPAEWKIDDLAIIAFLYNDEGVLQVQKIEI